MVDPDILNKIKYARAKQNITSIFLYTNGILLNKFGYKNILDSGLNRLAISTYVGSKEEVILNTIRKTRYENVIQNIRNI